MTRSAQTAAPNRTTSPPTAAAAGSSAGPSGAPAPTASASRTQRKRCGSAATPLTWTAMPWPRKSSMASPRWTPPAAPPKSWPPSPAGNGESNHCTGSATPPTPKTPTPATPATAPRSWPPCEHRYQPAAPRRNPRDNPHPPGHQPRPHPCTGHYPAIDQHLSDFADPVAHPGPES